MSELLKRHGRWFGGFRLAAVAVLFLCTPLRAQMPAGDEPGQSTPQAQQKPIVPPTASSTPLEYPEGAIGGATVVIELTVDADGRVTQATVLSGESPFAEAAAASAKNWKFSPARRNNSPIAARIRYSVEFTPPEPAQGVAEPAASVQIAPTPQRAAQPAAVEITVLGERAPAGSVIIKAEEARALPGTFGDPLRAIEAQPGVVPIVSGLPAFFIRGAPPANVGFFFDGIDLPLLYHAFFGPSVIHPGFIDSVAFYPGAAPANFGRFAGPIVSVNAGPLSERTSGEGSLRIIDVGALLESGALKHCPPEEPDCAKGGARAAGRYSYAGLVLSLLTDAELDYWDYQAQASYPLSRHDSVSVLAFGGYDLFRPPQTSENSGGEIKFHRVDLRWDRKSAGGTTLRVAATLGYDRAAGANNEASVVMDRSLRLRSELAHPLGKKARILAGADGRADRFGLGTNPRSFDYPDYSTLFPERTDWVGGAYLGLEVEAAPGIRVSPSLRGDIYYGDGTTKTGLDPRVSAEFEISRTVRIEHSLGIAHQRPNFAAQVPGAQVADLTRGLQWALLWSSGVHLNFEDRWSASAAVFRSAYFHALDPIGGARDFTIDRTVLDRRSTILAAGLELRVSRPLTNRLGGFVSYTLSRTEQSTGNQKSPSGFDRTHVLQAALSYDLGKNFRVGARGVFYTGIPELNLAGSPHFTGRRRGTPFFRLDFRAEKRFRISSHAYWGLIAEILNATSTREVVRLDCGEICRERMAGPVILPSVGVEGGF